MALLFYRLAYGLSVLGVPLLPQLFEAVSRWLFDCTLPSDARLGRGITFPRGPRGVRICSGARVGAHCVVGKGVRLTRLADRKKGPEIEDYAVLGDGVVIEGPIRVGAFAIIQAGVVLRESVPPHAVITPRTPTTIRPPPTLEPKLQEPQPHRGSVLREQDRAPQLT